VSPADRDHSDAVAGYLGTGVDPGLPAPELVRLDLTRSVLSRAATWANPPPELVDALLDRIAIGRGAGRRTPVRAIALGTLAAAVLVVVGLLAADRLGRPDPERQVALAGTELAPDASATATLRDTPSGVSIRLQIVGLVPAPLGFYYQGWVTGPAGSVPIGTFHLREGDDEPVDLWSGVDLSDYPTLTVTLEPEDGNPASSGQRVLTSQP
jgi:hypothetical protein